MLRGSPPRVRGKGQEPSESHPLPGITPACAGKRQRPAARLRGGGDHPRVCGEKPVAMHSCITSRGSPPRVRGKGGFPCLAVLHPGITPACAGKRYGCDDITQGKRDHPRVCGEKGVINQNPEDFKGSPPRVRGKALQAIPATMSEGITPACAGKSP